MIPTMTEAQCEKHRQQAKRWSDRYDEVEPHLREGYHWVVSLHDFRYMIGYRLKDGVSVDNSRLAMKMADRNEMYDRLFFNMETMQYTETGPEA